MTFTENFSIPEFLHKDALSIREAQRVFDLPAFFASSKLALEFGIKIRDKLDEMAIEEGIMLKPCSISGPDVLGASIVIDRRDGSFEVEANNAGPEDELAPYEAIEGVFYGFDVVIETHADHSTDPEGVVIDDDERGDKGIVVYSPVLVYSVKVGSVVDSPLGRFEPRAHGRVATTELSFEEDYIISKTVEDAMFIHDKGQYATDRETTELAYFFRFYDELFSERSFHGMVSCIEDFSSIKSDSLNTELTDTLMRMLEYKMQLEPSDLKPYASCFYLLSNIVNGEPLVQCVSDQEGGAGI